MSRAYELRRSLCRLSLSLLTALVLYAAFSAGPAHAANGCGPNDWRGRFVPNAPLGFQFGSACNWHDRCYGTDWRWVAYSYAGAKDHCDRWFYFKMSQVCAYQGSTTGYQWCQYIAYSYYAAVRDHGRSAYYAAQH
jgi:hypothetical protein